MVHASLFPLHISLTYLLIFALPSVVAQELDDHTRPFYFYEDTTARLLFKEIVKPSFDSNFKLLKTNSIWFDITQSAIWIKFKVQDPQSVQQYLELTCPNLHEVVYYQPYSKGKFKEYATGFMKSYASRPIQIDRFTFPITPGQEWHYIKLKSDHFMNTDFRIESSEEIIRHASTRNLLYNLYAGLMLVITICVSFYIYLIRYFSYLFYIAYVFFISSINLTEKGFYFQLFWPNIPEFNFYFPLLPFGVSIFMLLFLRRIWVMDKKLMSLYRLNLWIITVLPFLWVVCLLAMEKYQQAIIITQVHSFVACLLVIIISAASYANVNWGCKLSFKLIIAGLCVFCLGVLIYLLTQNHFLPVNFFTDNSILFGSTLEVGLFTTALVLRSDVIYRNQKNKLSRRYLQQ